MLFATMGQGKLFLWMMASGVGIGLWYGAVMALRGVLHAGFWITLACDLLFGLGAAVILCGMLIAGTWGQLRPFALLGACLGAVIAIFGLVQPAGRCLSGACGLLRCRLKTLRQTRLMKFLLK